MSLSPPGAPSPDPTSPIAETFLRLGAPMPTSKGPEPCIACTDEFCPEDCSTYSEWANPRLMDMNAYHTRWDEEAAYEGMRRTWGSTLDIYVLTAKEGPHKASNPITILNFLFHLNREVIP